MRRSPLKRGTSVLRRTRVNPISKKRRAMLPERSALIARVHSRDRICQFGYCCALHTRWFDAKSTAHRACGGPLDVHEIIPRSAWSAGWLDDTNCVLLCRMHHDWVGDNPNLAHSIGLHGFAHERTDK